MRQMDSYHYKGMSISSNSFLRSFERFKNAFGTMQADEAPYPVRCMTEKLDPLIMEEMCGTTATCMQYVCEILRRSGYAAKEAVEKALYLTTNYRDHSTVLSRQSLIDLGFRVVSDRKYRGEWAQMRQWLRKYVGRAEAIHHMKYYLPNKPARRSSR